MIFANVGEPMTAVFDAAPAGLVGTIAIRILRNSDGATVMPRTTGGITEAVAGAGIYLWKGAAPGAFGEYTVVWDTGTATPGTASTEELKVGPAVVQPFAAEGGQGSTASGLVAKILRQGIFDTDEPTALDWLDQRHKLMCMRTKCFRRKIQLATVANQQGYPVPAEVQEIREVLVQSTESTGGLGVPYGAGRHSDLADGALHYLWLGGTYMRTGGGIFVRDESNAGEDLVALYPTPTEAGRQITIHAVCRPATLELTTRLRTPPEFDDALVAGAIATGLLRLEAREDLAAPNETIYGSGCSELQEQVNDRFRPTGAVSIRVRGYNA